MRDYPLIKFVVVFAAGIALERVLSIDFEYLILSLCIGLILTAVIFVFSREKRLWGTCISCYPLILLLGASYISLRSIEDHYYPFKSTRIKNIQAFGMVEYIDLPDRNKFSFLLSVDSLKLDSKVFRGGLKLLINCYSTPETDMPKICGNLGVGSRGSVIGTLSRARERRNPGEFDYYDHLVDRGISGILSLNEPENISLSRTGGFNLADAVYKVRQGIYERIRSLHSKETTGLLKGLLLAERNEIDFDLREKFVNAGVVHILAVSGLHVGYIILIFLVVFGRFSIRIRYPLTIIGIFCFMIITGAPTSVVRASIMSSLFLAALLTERTANPFNSLALAALLVLLLDPAELFRPGFQLSFSAVLSILYFYPKFKNSVDSLPIKSRLVKNPLLFGSVTLSAQIGTLPFTLFYFEKLSLIAVAANLIAVPMIGMIVAIAIPTLIIDLFWSTAAVIFASANNLLIYILNKFIYAAGSLEFSYLNVQDFSLPDTIAFYGALILLTFLWQNLKRPGVKLAVILLLSVSTLLVVQFDDSELMPARKLSILCIDVGQGDSFLINFPNGETALIDAGNATPFFDNGERVIKPLLDRLGVVKIDHGFVSHIDADHYKGYIFLIKNDLIARIYKPPPDTALEKEREFERLVRENNIPIEYYGKKRLTIGNCAIYFLNNLSRSEYLNFDSNDNSGVFKLVYGSTSFLFTGDAGYAAERFLVGEYGSFLESDFLKIGHHGSLTSTSDKFLSAVKPEFALISAGRDNPYGHPSPEVVKKLKEEGIKIIRIDCAGASLLVSNGEEIDLIDWQKD